MARQRKPITQEQRDFDNLVNKLNKRYQRASGERKKQLGKEYKALFGSAFKNGKISRSFKAKEDIARKAKVAEKSSYATKKAYEKKQKQKSKYKEQAKKTYKSYQQKIGYGTNIAESDIEFILEEVYERRELQSIDFYRVKNEISSYKKANNIDELSTEDKIILMDRFYNVAEAERAYQEEMNKVFSNR